MAADGPDRLPIRAEDDIGKVRRAVARIMEGAGASALQKTKFVTAASELSRNTLIHGGGGEVQIEPVRQVSGGKDARFGVALTFTDAGPGIPDIARALTDGFSTGNGMGLGLGGAKRLCDEFDISSEPGAGTRVRIAMWVGRR